MLKQKNCDHLESFTRREPQNYQCDECVKTGDRWVHLRTCQTCGITLCCDSSPNKHASRHAAEHDHPVVISAEPGETWAYCYVHQELRVS
ncbi:MAG: UBP-type zinc finger domain-containing protein [Bacteroidota bacterium]